MAPDSQASIDTVGRVRDAVHRVPGAEAIAGGDSATRGDILTRGVLIGLGATGGVITSAGLVLAGTFAVLATLPVVAFAELGFAVALGVLLDTLIVRSVLVTALNLDVGRHMWWPSDLA